MEPLIYRKIEPEELKLELFKKFVRRQEVTKCLRKEGDVWVERYAPFTDDWSGEDYRFLVECLSNTMLHGGVVFGAFEGAYVKGFASVEGTPLGRRGNYLDLTSLHVSKEMRGHGVGTRLFHLAAGWALAKGGEKLYISSHSAVESQKFYQAMGCRDAMEPNEEHVKKEPFDRQLEYVL